MRYSQIGQSDNTSQVHIHYAVNICDIGINQWFKDARVIYENIEELAMASVVQLWLFVQLLVCIYDRNIGSQCDSMTYWIYINPTTHLTRETLLFDSKRTVNYRPLIREKFDLRKESDKLFISIGFDRMSGWELCKGQREHPLNLWIMFWI